MVHQQYSGFARESGRVMSISILIMIITTMMMMVIVESYDAYEKDRVPHLLGASRYFRAMKERRVNRGYVEQCRATNLRKEQLGHVNVFAFLDPLWYYSYRQVIMLELLKKRLEKSGFLDILFFVVMPPLNFPEESLENDAEIIAWKEISNNIPEYFLGVDDTLFTEFAKQKNGVTFLQDTNELGIWESFRAAKDEIVIIDRCGKLTYQLIVPWSILYFPYAKAAILSTYKEDPCGSCDDTPPTVHNPFDQEEYLLRNVNSVEMKIDKNLDTHTENTSTASEAASTSFEESKKIAKDDKNRGTIIPPDLNEKKVYSVTTEASTVQAITTESIKKDDNVKENTTFIDKNIKITPEVPLEEEQVQIPNTTSDFVTSKISTEAQDYVSPNKQMNGNNYDSLLLVNNSSTNLTTNEEYHHGKSDVNSEETKKGEEVNRDIEHKELQIEKNETIPLRIILYAPHLHEENGSLNKYTHLVLRTGNPDYHDHFHSQSTTSDQKSVILKESDPMILNDKKLTEYVDSINESPGLYGETADYWQSADTYELNTDNENTEFPDYDYATAEITGTNVNDALDSESNGPSDIDTIDSDTSNKNTDKIDDVMQRRLNEHYNRLLTWIYYSL
ncbi:uncharacterized protein LOC143422403 isoform X2 [Xylocopa sonorina]|uniref:uncharacterized protein LOC143422403 isoform X2 n=1 Tax=Xylocopa sonorina TaxID=1818115 RepID=UPI00403B2C4E